MEKSTPFFYYDGTSCSDVRPLTVIITIDNTEDSDFLNSVVSAICSDSLGFTESTEPSFKVCVLFVTQAMTNEILSVHRENGLTGFNAKWWRR